MAAALWGARSSQNRWGRAAGCRVAVGTDESQAARSLYVAGAAIGAGLAYLAGVAPNGSPAALSNPRSPPRRATARAGAGRARDRGHRRGGRHAGHPVGAGHGRAARQRRRQAARRRPDRRGRSSRKAISSTQGDVLFRLDDRLVKAQIAQAEANIAKDQASLRDAEATLARREALIGKKIVTEAALDQARYAVEGSRPASPPAGRCWTSQKTQLDYLTIRAPITGRTGSLSGQARRHGARAGRRRAGHHQPDQADPGHLLRAAERAWRRAARARRQGHGRDRRRRRRQAHGRAGHHRLHRQPGRQADRHHHRQGAWPRTPTRCSGRAVGGGGAHRRGQAAHAVGAGDAPCCRPSRA